jgi:prepilin signal peptidase PulO-like enzyme (type II secretory pathway)
MLCAVLTIFLAALGACIGSFLNVVVYRLPRGLSVSQPRRSFCPSCEKQIEWYDNIPILSWIVLRGQCRNCGLPISPQYPLVESAAVVVTLLVWQAVRTAHQANPIEAWWPVLAGMLGLFWCLLALSAMDLKEYYVDIRLTWIALAIGLGSHAMSPAGVWPAQQYVSPKWGAFAIGATLMLVLLNWLWPMPEEQPITGQGEKEGPQTDEDAPPSTRRLGVAPGDPTETAGGGTGGAGGSRSANRAGKVQSNRTSPLVSLVLLLGIATAALVALAMVTCQADAGPAPANLLIAIGLAVLFGSILAASWLPTEADEAIAQAVENERSYAVRQAAKEAVVLLACIAAGIGLMWLVQWDGVSRLWLSAFEAAPSDKWWPIAGLTTALFGWAIAGGVCWSVRVLFTLALRKEALGFGDIHIIAAAGAVMGPHLAIAGFFLAAPVALLGTLVLVFRKRYRTLPFGPWLSVGFLLALLWSGPLMQQINSAMAALDLILAGGPTRPI